MNLTVANSPYRVDQRAAPRVPPGDNQPPAPIDPSIDKWFFISVVPSHNLLIVGICTLGIVWRVTLEDMSFFKRHYLYLNLGRIHSLLHIYHITVSLVNIISRAFL